MSKRIYLLNGPNLNLLGQRQTELYGSETLDDVTQNCEKIAASRGMTIESFQSNSEGQLVDWVHEARQKADAIIINPGAYSHTSIALLDALNTFDGIVIEVHISNIHRREEFRHHSYISLRSDGVIVGLGTQGYGLAVEAVQTLI